MVVSVLTRVFGVLLFAAVVTVSYPYVSAYEPRLQSISISCRQDGGYPTDGFVALKEPGSPRVAVSNLNNPSSHFSFSSFTLSDVSSAVGATINQLLQRMQNSSVGYLFYNDETPSGHKSTSYGHTKGVLGFTSEGGFWLIHSVPQYPDASSSYVYPSGQTIYGQSFFCGTYSLSTLETIAQQIAINHPQFYASNVPDDVARVAPTLKKLADGYSVLHPATANAVRVSTLAGYSLTVFAKNSDWNSDLWSLLVAKEMKCSLYVESWMRPYQPSCCTPTCPFNTENVATLSLDGDTWKETQDHSKWAISSSCSSGSNDLFCVGDINRDDSQRNRAGGTICGRDQRIRSLFNAVITSVDHC